MFFSKLNKIENVLDKFSRVIEIEPSRCVRLRSKRGIGCGDCISACPESAIDVTRNDVLIDSAKCSECTICCKICGSGVFTHKNFSEEDFFRKLSEQAAKEPQVFISCSRLKLAGNEKTIPVPCLAWVDISVLIFVLASGAKRIYLRHEECDSCRSQKGDSEIKKEIGEVSRLFRNYLDKNGVEIVAGKAEPLPEPIQAPPEKESELLTRRELFGYFRKKTQVSIAQALFYASESRRFNFAAEVNVVKDKIKVPMRKRIFNHSASDVFTHLERSAEISSVRYVSSLNIESARCDLCGVCYKLCPAGALKETVTENSEGSMQKSGISFTADICIKCGLCIQLCTSKAISFKMSVTPEEYIESLKETVQFCKSAV